MNKPNRALTAWLLACLPLSAGCDEALKDPEGPLLIERLTLLDASSRDAPVFTDTSSPADCTAAASRDTERCQNDPFKDRFGSLRSPPTPSSGEQIRVVFNKLPLRLGDRDLEVIRRAPNGLPSDIALVDPSVLALACDPAGGCTAAPPAVASDALAGSQASPDPTAFPYGPALQLVVTPDAAHPLAALEPATTYRVVVSPQLGDRDGSLVQLDGAALALLRFTTEPFRVLQAGLGDGGNDAWVYGDAAAGSAASPYAVDDLAQDGVLALRLNAPIDDSLLTAASAQATALGKDVPLKLTLRQLKTDMDGKRSCDLGDARGLYLFPAAGSFGDLPAGTVVDVTLRGADVRDVSQAAGHPKGAGRHALPGDVHLRATLTGKAADDKYGGLTTAQVRAAAECP